MHSSWLEGTSCWPFCLSMIPETCIGIGIGNDKWLKWQWHCHCCSASDNDLFTQYVWLFDCFTQAQWNNAENCAHRHIVTLWLVHGVSCVLVCHVSTRQLQVYVFCRWLTTDCLTDSIWACSMPVQSNGHLTVKEWWWWWLQIVVKAPECRSGVARAFPNALKLPLWISPGPWLQWQW